MIHNCWLTKQRNDYRRTTLQSSVKMEGLYSRILKKMAAGRKHHTHVRHTVW